MCWSHLVVLKNIIQDRLAVAKTEINSEATQLHMYVCCDILKKIQIFMNINTKKLSQHKIRWYIDIEIFLNSSLENLNYYFFIFSRSRVIGPRVPSGRRKSYYNFFKVYSAKINDSNPILIQFLGFEPSPSWIISLNTTPNSQTVYCIKIIRAKCHR